MYKQKKLVPCDDTYPSYHRYPRPMECFDLSQYSPINLAEKQQFDLQSIKYSIRHIGNSHKNYKSHSLQQVFSTNLSCRILEKKVHQCLKIVFTIHVCTSTNNHIAKLNIIYLFSHVRNQCSPFLLSDRWLFFVADFHSVFSFFRHCA